MSRYADLIAALDPPVSYRVGGGDAWPSAAGGVLTQIDRRAVALLGAPFADSANDYLARWERLLAIAAAADVSMARRAETVRARLVALGGLSKVYFIDLAASLGYTITIDELEPFCAGRNRAGDPLASPDIVWTWRVNVQDKRPVVYRFRAGAARSGDKLSSYGIAAIEEMFLRLKPAHTTCVFSYQE